MPGGEPPTELIIQPLIEGTGPAVESGQSITVHYTGVLWAGGTVFDSSWESGSPGTFEIVLVDDATDPSVAADVCNRLVTQEKVDAIQARIDDLEARLYREQQAYQFAKATYDQDKYIFEAARAAGASNAERLGTEVQALGVRTNELLLTWEASIAERAGLQQQLEQFTGDATGFQRQIAEMEFEANRLRTRAGVLAPSAVKAYFRDAPLLDFMAPTLRVQQRRAA